MDDFFSSIHEECGVVGLSLQNDNDVAAYAYYALYALQHRGQQSAGIAVNDDGVITAHCDEGLVNDVFDESTLASLGTGRMAVGHVRYATTGDDRRVNSQPLVVNHVKGSLVLAHNGNLTNDAELREELELQGSIFHTTTDSEVIAYTIIKERLNTSSIEEAVSKAMERIEGAYSLVIMSPTKLIAARDPHGFRPLCMGEFPCGGIAFASETCALDAMGAHYVRDIEPGEIVVAKNGKITSRREHCGKKKHALCVFEYIYFARPDSYIEGCSVHAARKRAGAFLALEHPVQADVVIGVPDSGIDAALGFSQQSGIPYGVGFIKNKYIGRTFISPNQTAREKGVRIKLNPVVETVKGKRVVLIDDSIVRGTTIARIVKLLRSAGATEVHVRSAAPKFLYPCYFGTDVPSREELLANKYDDIGLLEKLNVDSIGFLSIENAKHLAGNGCLDYCVGCFSGEYPCDPPKRRWDNKYARKIGAKEE
ncbi:MAG: amidophosphoribosyltransferase [Eubacteriales bacterium]|nr:amidophosphoribosyltransferase [Clostridium sp.]MDD7504058.1 amidophosphoribosyltransferase [Clostridium sp.]MDY5755823.1 amidophosphoribosyltransferase [Eubacteriales bacterium]MDY6089316.1 amidophosphoribosyltransferase [Eubacteriales bacterium]